MLIIKSDNCNDAWYSCLNDLYCKGSDTDNEKFYRDELAIIEIKNPKLIEIPKKFPMSQESINIINNYIISGKNEEIVCHEWTKLYYHRIFDEPNSQMKYVLKKLSEEEPSGNAQISIWNKMIDQDAKISPCTQILWFRRKENSLEIHVHAHSSDAYKKLLMNIQEFISVQHYVANKLSLNIGKYYHIIDSCHIYQKNITEVEKILNKKNISDIIT